MKSNEYKCAQCGNVYETGQTEEEAITEMKANFGEHAKKEDMAVICDDCYNDLMPTIKN